MGEFCEEMVFEGIMLVRNVLRDGPLNRCMCLTVNVYTL